MLQVDFTSVGRPVIEDLTSQVDGVKTAFTTVGSFSEVERVFLNGRKLQPTDDFTVTLPNTITFVLPPRDHPLDGKARIIIEYFE